MPVLAHVRSLAAVLVLAVLSLGLLAVSAERRAHAPSAVHAAAAGRVTPGSAAHLRRAYRLDVRH